jgi:DNA-binding IclR family transcriptional regulator
MARPFVQKLAREARLTVHLGTLMRGKSVYIDNFELPGFVKLASWIATDSILKCTYLGKALTDYYSVAPKIGFSASSLRDKCVQQIEQQPPGRPNRA